MSVSYGERYATGQADPDLEETMFQYGRYLLASCSRAGGLPANLQGLWNDSVSPPSVSSFLCMIYVFLPGNRRSRYLLPWGANS